MVKAKATSKEPSPKWTLDNALPWLLLIAGIIVTMASIALSVEIFNRLKNPSFVPICNLNPVLSCTSVADSNQSHLFGFPNYFLGIGGYAAIAAVGAVMLAGAKMKRWFWVLFQIGITFAFAFTTWLQFQTLYRIGALCIFCMILWVFTGPIFWYTTLYNIRHKNIKLPKSMEKAAAFAVRHHGDILLAWYLVIIVLILKRFWYYWSTLI